MPRPAPSQAWRTGAAEEVLPVQGDARATAGRTIGRAVPREEDVTFASGSRGMRMEKGRGAAAAGQLLYIRAGRLCDPPLGGHFPGNSRTRVLVCGLGVFVCALHGVSPRDRWLCVLPRWPINVNVNVNVNVHLRDLAVREHVLI